MIFKKMNTIDKVKEFNKAFNLEISEEPYLGNLSSSELRYKLMLEELDEYRVAYKKGDIVEILDALTDMQYILDGIFIYHGLHPYKDKAFNEVHVSNLSKLDENGNPIYREDGKVMKGFNYFPPNLKSVLDT